MLYIYPYVFVYKSVLLRLTIDVQEFSWLCKKFELWVRYARPSRMNPVACTCSTLSVLRSMRIPTLLFGRLLLPTIEAAAATVI